MSHSIPNFQNAKILVVGDLMLDRYWHGSANRMSPEAPVPVVNVQGRRSVPGGAGNVALNLRALGCEVQLVGLIGDDEEGRILDQQLREHGVIPHLQVTPDHLTITKLRVMGRNQQLVRLDFEQGFHQVDMAPLLAVVEAALQDAQVLVISDYNKGIVSCIPHLIALGQAAGVQVFVDPKSQDFALYRGATCLTPNLKEFEAVVGACASVEELVTKGATVLQECDLPALLVTRGEAGMTLLQQQADAVHFSAHSREVYDVTGAGDTVIAVLAAGVACEVPLADAVMMANMAAGISVKKLGAATVSAPELRRALQRYNDSHLGMVSQNELMQVVADARAHGEKVVMTNGCFDLLHAGHVYYLERAKAMGDRLVVAVNSDESVSRLKGPTRPLVTLQERMQVLAALRAVDWVVSFSEDTPRHLIAQVLPDVLVKGADYAPEQIAGALEVIAAGGRVETITLLEGASTTNIIGRMHATSALQEDVIV